MVLRVMESEVIGYEKQRKEKYQEQRRGDVKFNSHEIGRASCRERVLFLV